MVQLILLLSLCLSVTFANVCDDPNSEPRPCIDYCAPSCEEPQGKDSCIEICSPGCNCVEGFVEDGDRCVRLSECENDVCANDPNTEFSTCGTLCPATCEQPNGPGGCWEVCVAGCFCRNGFVRNSGVCVPLEECPNQGEAECEDPNAVYNECGSACPRTCEPVDEEVNCPDVCIPGCHCVTGFVPHNGRCIDLNECPNESETYCEDPNAIYNECGSACPRTCDPVDEDVDCPDVCIAGCHCATGFVLHNGSCIDTNDCPTGN